MPSLLRYSGKNIHAILKVANAVEAWRRLSLQQQKKEVRVHHRIVTMFLTIVAIWRLSLLFYFIRKVTELKWWIIFTNAMLPICLIIASLTVLNLHRVVFNIMGGIRTETAHDSAYAVLFFLTTISIVLVGPLLLSYFISIYKHRKELHTKWKILSFKTYKTNKSWMFYTT